jgi:hypothetical protein
MSSLYEQKHLFNNDTDIYDIKIYSYSGDYKYEPYVEQKYHGDYIWGIYGLFMKINNEIKIWIPFVQNKEQEQYFTKSLYGGGSLIYPVNFQKKYDIKYDLLEKILDINLNKMSLYDINKYLIDNNILNFDGKLCGIHNISGNFEINNKFIEKIINFYSNENSNIKITSTKIILDSIHTYYYNITIITNKTFIKSFLKLYTSINILNDEITKNSDKTYKIIYNGFNDNIFMYDIPQNLQIVRHSNCKYEITSYLIVEIKKNIDIIVDLPLVDLSLVNFKFTQTADNLIDL